MATKGFFTFDDLYLGRGKEYLYKKSLYETTSSARTNSRWFPSYSVDEDLSPSFFDGQEESLVDTMKSTTTAATLNLNFVDKLEKINTFAYLYWFLIALAVALTLLLMVVITYYCCHHCQRKRKQRKEKQEQFLPNFYRYKTVKGDVPAYNLYQSSAPLFFASPVPSYKSKLSDSADDQLLRQGLDAVGTPQNSRTDSNTKDSIDSFTSSASDMLTEIKDRLSSRSFKRSMNVETQGANLALSDDSKNISS